MIFSGLFLGYTIMNALQNFLAIRTVVANIAGLISGQKKCRKVDNMPDKNSGNPEAAVSRKINVVQSANE